jgi:hypothetical protein
MTKVDKEPDGTTCHTDREILSWQHGQYKRTVTLGKIKVPVIRSSAAYKNFSEYLKLNKNYEITVAYTGNIPQTIIDEANTMPTMQFDTGTNSIDGYSDTFEGKKPEDEIMVWHIRLAQMPFNKLTKMAHAGDLPKQEAKSSNLMHACMHGKATKIPWRIEGESIEHIKPSKLP